MFGLKGKEGTPKLVFALEKELKAKPERYSELKRRAATKLGELKTSLREGLDGDDFKKTEALLHGYEAFDRVLGRIQRTVNG
ncbi:DUF5398 family protein [Simkania negevensis]|uniref:DUF5398 family protein n=1 Tax=Simkania negevensis TaxID=83561 RepID=A0ABS3AQJ8_9BACT|nr:DUF5398 family protein [Simkania negevensis]